MEHYKLGDEFFIRDMTQKLIYSNLENSLTSKENKELAIGDAFGLGLFK